MPVIYRNPYDDQKIESMPIEMIAAYVPYASDLNLEAAAKVAHMRDVDASINLLLSIDDRSLSFAPHQFTELATVPPMEPPSLR